MVQRFRFRDATQPRNLLRFFHYVNRTFIGHLRLHQAYTGLDPVDLVLAYGVVSAGIDHIDEAGDLPDRYESIDQPVPDEVRRAISVSALARSLSLPRETARRRSAELIDRGIVSTVPEGLRANASFLATRAFVAVQTRQVETCKALLTAMGYGERDKAGPDTAWMDHEAIDARGASVRAADAASATAPVRDHRPPGRRAAAGADAGHHPAQRLRRGR